MIRYLNAMLAGAILIIGVAIVTVSPSGAQAQKGTSGAITVVTDEKSSAVQPSPTYVVPIPAASGTTIMGGNVLGDIIQFAIAIFGPVLAVLIATAIVKLLRALGVQVDDAHRARLEEIVKNGLAKAAEEAKISLEGKLPVTVKNQIIASTVDYAQRHGADTLKALGVDPNDPKAVEAIQARILKMLSA